MNTEAVSNETPEDFINSLSASITNMPLEGYINNHELAYRSFDKLQSLVEKIRVTTVEEYHKAMEVKSLLSSLSCYVFNNNKEDWEKYFDLEGDLGKKLYRFTKNYGKASPELRPLVKYLCWSRYYFGDEQKIADKLLKNSLLWKDSKGNYLVTGLHLAVGDNTFGISRRTGREYRLYVKSCAIQAFYVSSHWQEKITKMETSGKITVPLLDETLYSVESIGNWKGAAKISISSRDEEYILRECA